MGASCGRWFAYDGHDGGVHDPDGGVEMGRQSEPFLTLKARGPQALKAANELVAQVAWISRESLLDGFVIGKAIGKGATGTVKQATRRSDGLFCAVKTCPKVSLPSVEAMLAEVSILRRLDHPNVIKCLDLVDDGVCLHAVLENCAGGDLFDWFLSLPRYNDETIAGIIADIVGALSHCHQRGIVHRDLKPENILFFTNVARQTGASTATVKLCDFGCAFQLDMDGKEMADHAVLNSAQMQSMVRSFVRLFVPCFLHRFIASLLLLHCFFIASALLRCFFFVHPFILPSRTHTLEARKARPQTDRQVSNIVWLAAV